MTDWKYSAELLSAHTPLVPRQARLSALASSPRRSPTFGGEVEAPRTSRLAAGSATG